MAVQRPQTEDGGRGNHPGQKSGKVLFVASVYTHLAAFHIPFMKLLQERGYEIHAAASSAEGRKEDVEAARVTCWEIPFARSPYTPGNLRAYRELRALLRGHHFDLIHVHTPVAAFMGRYLAKVTQQGPVLYTAHGFHFYKGAPRRNWMIYYNAERLAARWTDGLVVMNGEDFDNAKKLGFEPEQNLFYVHGVGVDLTEFSNSVAENDSIRTTLAIDPRDVVVTCVAEFNDNKNHVFLLEAWREFTQRHNHGHLLLVGTGEKIGALQQRVKQEGISRVHFLGYRGDVPQILRETDIVTLVSRREGLPKAVMEAMAAGKPVVATNVRGNRDLVEHGKTGLLVELGDVPGLVNALERLTSDPELRAAMGATGQEKIRDYSLERILGEMAGIYGRYLR